MLTVDYRRLPQKPGLKLLDIGCGAGRHSFEALRRGYQVVAADLDAAVLKDVKAMGAAMIAENEVPRSGSLACVNASALELPFADGSFDVVIASEVMEHISTDRAALEEIERVTRPGGSVVVTVPRRWPERMCWALSKEYHSAAGGHVRIYKSAEMKEKLTAAGLILLGSHHAHALHSPYWWLKCAFGVANNDARVPSAYHRFLVWDIEHPHRSVALLEKSLNPLMGKSLAVYAEKPHA